MGGSWMGLLSVGDLIRGIVCKLDLSLSVNLPFLFLDLLFWDAGGDEMSFPWDCNNRIWIHSFLLGGPSHSDFHMIYFVPVWSCVRWWSSKAWELESGPTSYLSAFGPMVVILQCSAWESLLKMGWWRIKRCLCPARLMPLKLDKHAIWFLAPDFWWSWRNK